MPDPILQQNLLSVVLGKYLSGPATSIADPKLLPAVQQYKRYVASQLIPLARHDISRRVPDSPLLISRKLDGEFNAAIFRGGELFTVNPGGTVRVGLPFFDELKEQLVAANIESAMIAGEIYVDVQEDRRCRVHDSVSLLRHPESEEALARIRFAVFDLIELNGETISQPYSQTWETLEKTFEQGKTAHLVETVAATSSKEVEKLFASWVDKEGAEGVVVRSDTAGSFKLKPLFTLDAVVIGFTESTDERA